MGFASSTLLLTLHITLIVITILSFSSSVSTVLAISTPTKPITTTPTTKTSPPFKKIFAFGDSFTDTGNTRSISGPAGFGHVSNPPYGMTFFHHPTNRYSDGRLMIDFVAQNLSLHFLPPYVDTIKNNKGSTKVNANYGVNFAIAGSTAINHEFFEKNNLSLDITPQSIQTQWLWFNKYLESEENCKGSSPNDVNCKKLFEDSLIWVGEIGVNDYAYTVGSSVSTDTIRPLAIATVTNFLEALLNKGAKYVVIQGLPPTGCLTLSMTLAAEDDRDELGCVKSVNSQSATHNTVYRSKIEGLRKQFPGTTIVYLDYWDAYKTVLLNPAGYGFKELFKACCGSGEPPYNFEVFATCGTPSASACPSPAQYINWDGVHLTEAMYKVLTDKFLDGSFSSPPFSYLLGKKLKG